MTARNHYSLEAIARAAAGRSPALARDEQRAPAGRDRSRSRFCICDTRQQRRADCPIQCQAAVLAAVVLLRGEAGGRTPCGCLHHNRGPRGRPCAIALVEHREDAVSLGGRSATRSPRVGMQFGSAIGFTAKPQPRDTGRSSGDRLGRTVGLVLRRRAAPARASVSAPLLPLLLAVSGLDGHSIARPVPASTHPQCISGLRPAWTSRAFGPLGCAVPRWARIRLEALVEAEPAGDRLREAQRGEVVEALKGHASADPAQQAGAGEARWRSPGRRRSPRRTFRVTGSATKTTRRARGDPPA